MTAVGALSRELEVAKRLAREAAVEIMKIYARPFAVEFKSGDDPVTEADRLGNELILKGLRAAFPDDRLIGEEGSDSDPRTAASSRTWYVDPIDGTREFVAKNGEFCVMIGLAFGADARLGVVYRPTDDVLFSGISDQGAWKETRGGNPVPLTAPSGPARAGQLRIMRSRSHHAPGTDHLATAAGVASHVTLGSLGLKICAIAEDLGDIYFDLSGASSLWDTCGPEAILRGAGGVLTDVRGQRIDYRTPELRNLYGVMATRGIDPADMARKIGPVLPPLPIPKR